MVLPVGRRCGPLLYIDVDLLGFLLTILVWTDWWSLELDVCMQNVSFL